MPYYRLFYHFIWSTSERSPLIVDPIREPIYTAIKTKAEALDGIVHALNGIPDHVHLVATVPPKISLSAFIGQVKGSSSRLAAQISSELFAWQDEYGVLSISEANLRSIIHYVHLQQQHHAKNTLDPALETVAR